MNSMRFILLLCFSHLAFADPYQEGLKHYEAGDYAKAYCLWQTLADLGNPIAQYSLGWMFANGEGLAVDAKEAVVLWRKSAALGHPDAHFALALAYTTGEGVEHDELLSIKWHVEATRLGHEDSRAILLQMITDEFVQLPKDQQQLLQDSWRMLGTSGYFSGKSKLYSSRSGRGKVLSTAEKGDELIEFQSKGDWMQIGYPKEGLVGWVKSATTE